LSQSRRPRTFQDLILSLQRYWADQGCVILQPYDMPMGAGTFHSATFLRAIGPEPWSAAYVQPSRRPTDGRYGENPNRLQHYYQFQVVIKPSPLEIQQLYLDSLRALDIDPLVHDIRFVEDNWESPTLGAWGLGWEVWLNGMEVTQFTYFQQVGGLDCRPVTGEITYGLERIAMYLQGVASVYDLTWTDGPLGRVTYGDVFHQNEVEMSRYNFEAADTGVLVPRFDAAERACRGLIEAGLTLPAGTILRVISWHDNSTANRYNPDPTNWVGFGQRTIDDMAFSWVTVNYMSQEDFDSAVRARQAAASRRSQQQQQQQQ